MVRFLARRRYSLALRTLPTTRKSSAKRTNCSESAGSNRCSLLASSSLAARALRFFRRHAGQSTGSELTGNLYSSYHRCCCSFANRNAFPQVRQVFGRSKYARRGASQQKFCSAALAFKARPLVRHASQAQIRRPGFASSTVQPGLDHQGSRPNRRSSPSARKSALRALTSRPSLQQGQFTRSGARRRLPFTMFAPLPTRTLSRRGALRNRVAASAGLLATASAPPPASRRRRGARRP